MEEGYLMKMILLNLLTSKLVEKCVGVCCSSQVVAYYT